MSKRWMLALTVCACLFGLYGGDALGQRYGSLTAPRDESATPTGDAGVLVNDSNAPIPRPITVNVLIVETDSPAEITLGDKTIALDPLGETLAALLNGTQNDATPAMEMEELMKLLDGVDTFRGCMTTLSGTRAFMQIGRKKGRITSTRATSSGTTNTVTLENVGRILGVAPEIAGDRIQVALDYEASVLDPDAGVILAVTPDGEDVRTPDISVQATQTTVEGEPGKPVIAAGLDVQIDGGDDNGSRCIIVIANYAD